MRAYLLFVSIISFQVALSRPPISKDDLNFETINSKLSKLEPEKELDIGDREYLLGEDSSNAGFSHQSHVDPNVNYNANDAENEIEDGNSDDLFSETNDDENKTPEVHEKYNSDVKTVINAFMNLVPKNTTLAQLFRQIAALLKSDPDESTTASR